MTKIKVLAAGTFDLFHKGHQQFLTDVGSLGDEVHIIVARDSSVQKIKNFVPQDNQQQRKKNIENFLPKAHVSIGEEKNFLALPKKISPHVVALGYDQKAPKGLEENFPEAKIVRLNAYKPEQYKSSFFRKK